VLNARDLMFVDIDFQTARPKRVGLFARLFGQRAPSAPADNGDAGLATVRAWSEKNPDFTLRLYRTANGWRVAIIDRVMCADSELARNILAELGSDPLYRRLCEQQQCFRARLTPKPWRMNLAAPPVKFPRADAAEEDRFTAWRKKYDALAPKFATCRLFETIGRGEAHPALAPLLELHDSLTGVLRDAPLA
jgi:hypothetical protein